MQYFTITQSTIVGLLIAAVGQVVAFVPALAPEKQLLISVVSGAVAIAFWIANAIHHHAAVKAPQVPPPPPVAAVPPPGGHA